MTPQHGPGTRGSERLKRALDLYLSGADRESLLRDHPDLEELLAPMFAADSLSAEPETTSDTNDPVTKLGGFQILSELGRGGMGIVYEAYQPALSRKVALKVLPSIATLDPRAVSRFRREAAAAAALEHPGIVKVFELGHSGLRHWIAMELVPGGTLGERAVDLRRQGIPGCVATIAAVADALDVAHSHGLIHRDVKPANILLRADLSPVLTDFGLARNLTLPSASQSGGFVGTPYYASPEHVAANLVDARSDVFSLGATLYVLLTGVKPFPGETTDEVLARIQRDPPIDPARLQVGLPEDLCAIVLKALEKDPNLRYQTAADFAKDLRAFLAFEPVTARRPSPLARMLRYVRRQPLRAALGITLVALLGIGGYLFANFADLRAGEQVAVEAKTEQVLSQSLRDRQVNQTQEAIARIEALLQTVPDDEELVAELLFLTWLDKPRPRDLETKLDMLAVLRSHPAALEKSKPLQRLEALIVRESNSKEAGDAKLATLGESRLAMDFYVTGKVLSVLHDPGDLERDKAMLEQFRRAVLASKRPRIVFAYEYSGAVRRVGNEAASLDVETLLSAHWPDDAMAWTWIGIAAGGFDLERSLRATRKALELDPELTLAWRQLSVTLSRSGKRAEGEAALRKAASIDGDTWIGHATLARLHLMRGEFQAGLEEAERSLVLHPRARDPKILCALAKMHLGALQAAEAILVPLFKRLPNDMEVAGAIASLFVKQSRFDEAIPLLQRVVLMLPWSEIAWFDLGTALAMTKQYPGARTALEHSIALDPLHAQGHLNLGRLMLEVGELDRAELETRRAIELDKLLTDGWTNLLTILERRKDSEGVARHFAEWILARPEDGMPFVHQAHVLLKKRPFFPQADGDAVLALAQRAIRVQPTLKFMTLGLEVDVATVRGEWSKALEKLAEVRVAARAIGWTEETIKKSFDGLESRLRREGRRTAQSRPASGLASEPTSQTNR